MSIQTLQKTSSESGRSERLSTIALRRWFGYAALGAVLLVFVLGSPYFLSGQNLATILSQAAVTGIAGVGLAVVIINGGDDVLNGGIDLSNGAVAGLAGMTTALLSAHGHSAIVAVAGGITVALIIGSVNGVCVLLGLRPLLATLATMGIATSLELVLSQNIKIGLEDPFLIALRDASWLGIPIAAWVLFAVGMLGWWGFGRTRWGVNCYATGQNPVAAEVCGVSPKRYRFGSYIIGSALAGVAGVLLLTRLSAAVPGIGTQILLDIILVAYMSTIFSRRRLVSVPGTVLAALFVAALGNGLTLLGVASQWVSGAKGALILLVLASMTLRGRSRV
ncbi:ABC transporter permease [Glutamicibacter creatinolyticus]|uniref:ABC transporter permease n=1 Tax=Glutamicibacter TaxID=1742989 RepID=UPI0010FE85F6|nr:ABC transporter permease [Glutamicibacter sp. V16R2B1]TLK51972.1 ABC transporter permease [Glutamicibacter sp. V16R2B1]